MMQTYKELKTTYVANNNYFQASEQAAKKFSLNLC